MRLIDADKIVLDYGGLAHIHPYDFIGIAKYFADQIKAIPTITLPPNDPLTLEELREMDGPVWLECDVSPFTPNGGYYCLCQYGNITTPSGSQFNIEEIPHWKFYRRKPEEGDNEQPYFSDSSVN